MTAPTGYSPGDQLTRARRATHFASSTSAVALAANEVEWNVKLAELLICDEQPVGSAVMYQLQYCCE